MNAATENARPARPRVSIALTVKGSRRKSQVFAGIDAINRELELGLNPALLKRIRLSVAGGEAVEVEVEGKTYVFAPVSQ
ncbi:hypothetical protein [Burkholderia multivorans]|uniref:hypothetical protein n=1 Tax=Burkholderia multivorans TaxID=87883 RepID=UPI001B9BD601|nr:hypothetical protein [Burkholderia multivorans]MBR8019526.1 hypothetical protein [Burkholderia multivorans]MBU9647829.1 hypothetical protein [Burkholderia multivorans]MDN7756776.1 hypothetical protein [Burkholderia multivorans]MDN8008215.1 hypothetical protein [Burkholderia multivorans]HEF4730004.1 hypothetical protein [Burkholderia multivorans]